MRYIEEKKKVNRTLLALNTSALSKTLLRERRQDTNLKKYYKTAI
jgi:hypothetical protein